jgi:hypothetical protein
MSIVPPPEAGEIATIVESSMRVMPVDKAAPKYTPAVPVKPLPRIVTGCRRSPVPHWARPT